MSTVNLGDKVKDRVTGFVGVATGITQFLFGCTRVGVTPPIDKDGKPGDTAWFDEPQLEVVEAGVIAPATKEQREVGGPMQSIPKRNADPSR